MACKRENCIKNFEEKSEGKSLFGRPSRRREDNIKVNRKMIE